MTEDAALSVRKTGRTSLMFYALAGVGTIFVIAAISLDPAQSCTEYPCPLWLRSVAGGLGALFGFGGLAAIVKNYQFGSRVDLDTGTLYWWECYPPIVERPIDLARIARIEIEPGSDQVPVRLFDQTGNRVPISAQCLPWPYHRWAERLKQRFPHLRIVDIPGTNRVS